MTPAQKLGAYALVLGAALAGGLALGEVAGPVDTGDDAPTMSDDMHREDEHGDEHGFGR